MEHKHVVSLCERIKKEINKEIQERSLDSHYADSWGQSLQIHEDISRLEEKIISLDTIEKKIESGSRIMLSELGQLKMMRNQYITKSFDWSWDCF